MGAVSGSILAVCSCTILPLFGSIWRRGAGLGPAIAFLYSGPAINVLAVVLTATVLGAELGIARAVGAIGFSVLIGLAMHFIYRREELARGKGAAAHARGRGSPAAVADRQLFRRPGRGSGVRQLGPTAGGDRHLASRLDLEVAADSAGGAVLA
jgi:uncharacterized membrane protein YraQ (UPF0718 family)